MADEIERWLHKALDFLQNTADAGGYVKKETREDIHKTVSVITKCFNEMKTLIENSNKGKRTPQEENNEIKQNDIIATLDSRAAGQVAPSLGNMQEAASDTQTPVGEQRAESTRGREASSGQPDNHQRNSEDSHIVHDMEDKITRKLTYELQDMLENLSTKLKRMVHDEINALKANAGEEQANAAEVVNMENTTIQSRIEKSPNTWQEVRPRHAQKNPTQATQNNNSMVATPPTPSHANCAQSKRTETVGVGRSIKKTGEPTNSTLQAGESRAWIYVGRLHQETTIEMVKQHLTNLQVTKIYECEELNNKGSLKAVKIVIPLQELAKIHAPEAWPEGIVVRRYRLFRQKEQGVRLTD